MNLSLSLRLCSGLQQKQESVEYEARQSRSMRRSESTERPESGKLPLSKKTLGPALPFRDRGISRQRLILFKNIDCLIPGGVICVQGN